MKTRLRPILFRGTVLATLVASLFTSVSCMTTYDANGRPVQSVDPGMAVAGVAAAGLIGYALNDNDNHNHYYRGRSHYRPAPRHYHRRHY